MDLPGVLREVQRGIEIGGSALEGREQKSNGRRAHKLMGYGNVEVRIGVVVSEVRPSVLHGAHRAEEIVIDRVRSVVIVVPAPLRHVVHVVAEKDQEVGVLDFKSADDRGEQLFPQFRIREGGTAELGQELVLFTVRRVRGRERDGDEILPEASAQGPLEDGEIFFLFGVRQHPEGDLRAGDNVFRGVHITAVDLPYGGLLRVEAASDFVQFFLIHLDSFRMRRSFCF